MPRLSNLRAGNYGAGVSVFKMSLFADTSIWYAAADSSDRSNARSKTILKSGETLVTSGVCASGRKSDRTILSRVLHRTLGCLSLLVESSNLAVYFDLKVRFTPAL